MSLTADPSVSLSAEGNILASATSIGAGASNSGNIVDYSANSLGGWVGITVTGGSSVSTTNGLTVSVYPATDSTPHYATVANPQITIAVAASTVSRAGIFVGPGKYSITLTNTDATYGVTADITSNPAA